MDRVKNSLPPTGIRFWSRPLLWRRFWIYFHSGYCCPILARSKWIFLRSSSWEPGELVGGKAHKRAVTPLRLLYPVVYSDASLNLASSDFQIYHLSIPSSLWLWQLLLQISRCRLWLSGCAYLQISGWQFALWAPFSDGLKDSHWVLVCVAFSCYKNGSGDFQVL